LARPLALVLLCSALFCPALLLPTTASASSLRFRIHLHDISDARRPPLERLTRRSLRDVEAMLRARLDGTLKVDFVGSDEAFRNVLRAAGARGGSEPWLDGIALLHADHIVVRLGGGGLLRTGETTRHEIAHIAVHALAGGRHVPRWYHEGVAMLVAGEATLERLQEAVGAGAFDQLGSVEHLEQGFRGHRLAVQRAYALAAGFVRFCSRRTGNGESIADLHRRMALGLDFGPAFTATFGLPPNALFGLYTRYVGAAGSRWTQLMSDTVIWSLIGVLSMFAMTLAWVRRPRFSGEPMDLEAIARAGDEAMESGLLWMPPVDPDVPADPVEPDEPDGIGAPDQPLEPPPTIH